MNRKAVIFGIKTTKLLEKEKKLFKKNKPWGVIIFARNIDNMEQLKKLVKSIKTLMKDKNYPILIDEEGGEVSRLSKILDFSLFSQAYFGKLYKTNKNKFFEYYKIYINKVSNLLKKLQININTVPVLDVLQNKTNKIIKNRSFDKDPKRVSYLGSTCIKLYKQNKIATVIKHIPGHGCSSTDSHFKLPIVNKSKNELKKKDFLPFMNSKSLFAMTAHVVYKAYDPKYPATHSKIVIQNIIRKNMKFNGLLISDDISMKALKYDIKKNTTLALEAGCNLILHCNGNIREMQQIAKIVPKVDKFIMKKTSQFNKFLR